VSIVPLEQAHDEERYGGKAVNLGAALRAGLPVPRGVALGVEAVDALAAGDGAAGEQLSIWLAELGHARLAVRSSAVGEDSAEASFAGQHLTRLNVRGPGAVTIAVREVWASGRTSSALAYRRRLTLAGEPRVAVIVQELVLPECAGVLFTRNPLTGADERVIDAAWGLGEAVVSGLVTPDRWRLRRGGELVEEAIGEKDLEITWAPEGGTVEREVPADRASVPCLGAERLAALEDLAARCERWFEGPSDLEWAFTGTALHLLQRRAVTR
jgi:pyruvate, water dikinase